MFVVYFILATISFEMWISVKGENPRPPKYTHYVDELGRVSGDGGPTGLNWPECIIPYYIDPYSYDYESQQKILQIMETQYHQKTCIRFRPYQQGDPNWIEIANKHAGCSAMVGMQTFGGQLVNLALDCIYDVTITHELMHAVGFNHQHTAYNRDDYIIIHWENILEETMFNFNTELPEDNQDGQYGFDFESAMMYGRYAFSKNNQPVIDAKPPYVFTQQLYGNDYGLDEKDVGKIQMRYQNSCSCYNNWGKSGHGGNNYNHTLFNEMLKTIPAKIPTKFPV